MTITIELQSSDLSLLREAIYSRQRIIDELLDKWRDMESDDAHYLCTAYSKDQGELTRLDNMLKMEYSKELAK